MMKRLLMAVPVCILLSGCAAKFNQTNYNRLVTIAVITSDAKKVCQDVSHMTTSFTKINTENRYAIEDAAGRSDSDLVKMLNSQQDEITRFLHLLEKGKVSSFYCQLKVNNIYQTNKIITKSEGNKLKLL